MEPVQPQIKLYEYVDYMLLEEACAHFNENGDVSFLEENENENEDET